MTPERSAELWAAYRARRVSQAAHSDDWMLNGALRHGNGWRDYELVGTSGVRAIHAALLSAPTEQVRRAMDFGCGHGRVARYMRAYLPDAEMFFADIDQSGAAFCAEQFQGTPVRSNAEFSRLALPSALDLIWVGSVFTHIDYDRAKLLFGALMGALAPQGILVATFHGPRAYATKHGRSDGRDWQPLVEQYERTGAGYKSYGMPEWGDWGVSLFSAEAIVGLGVQHPTAKMIGYTEAGWANIQDVGVWTHW